MSRPKNSFFARQRENKEAKKVEDFLLKRSLMGQYLPALVTLAVHMIEAIKEIDITEQQAFDYFADYSGQNLD